MLEIGTELARISGDGPEALRVVGIESPNAYVCQTLPFGPNLSYSPEALRLLYGAENPEIAIVEERDFWKRLSTKTLRTAERSARREAAKELPTPEMVFKAAAAKAS